MPLVNFSNVDFDEIKQSIKDYLRSNSNFTDYDFEGSNLSTIIDTLAYNSYISSYNANMVSNEVFLDSATLRENVVSIARNIGYLPRSRKSSRSNISFEVDLRGSGDTKTSVVSVTLKAGAVALSGSTFNNSSFTFCIMEDITVPVDSTGFAVFDNVDVYEGSFLNQTYDVQSRLPNQKYILPNTGIDTDSIRVSVKVNSNSTVSRKYSQYTSLINADKDTPLFFLRETEGERYELLFGDGIFGTKLQEPNQVVVQYLTCSGSSPNGISNLTFIGRIEDNNGSPLASGVSGLTINESALGGDEIESVESIKKLAPNIYASQDRAVTSTDFESLVPRIYTEAESVAAYGGEELNPPQYGKVFVSIKPFNGVFLSEEIKRNLKLELAKYSVAGIITEIIDLNYLFIEIDTNVYYNSNLAPGPSQVRNVVTNNIIKYSDSTQLNKFGARFKYSKFGKIIDDSHDSITSNITTVKMRRDLQAILNQFIEYSLTFGNRIHVKSELGFNIKTSGFSVSGIAGTVYMSDAPNANLTTGTIFMFKLDSPTEPVILKRNIGTIDYITGLIKLNPLNVISTEVTRGTSLIEVSSCPYSNDVLGLRDLYLQMDTSNLTVNMVPDQVSSGSDISGGSYTVTSSYSNGSLTR
tara:strand:- start:14547 stop:16463 length:1917 start_codon:yes stop_codon:yes gene_type:complete